MPGGQKAVHRTHGFSTPPAAAAAAPLSTTCDSKRPPAHTCFKVGVTVAYVKAFLAEQHQLEFAKLKLLTGGRLMIDPLSLGDCPGVAPGKEVEVEVSLG
ncbi:hypothetical protein HXX76_005374 [Chlamydomonas incerta]|uniref:Ubiquitin-like domain-containing protein n=1 Tax=Chlamydomonas incerta TaxID=51695 RepID=A0A835T4W7_CHLIN|nr:hypothetical protein HXX76_005374 [Chlamydomonas incerta]|eukprot:KAG2438833.1 hypothetical protein HXX76_005374 [Chlamydomonas incerta]